MIFKRIELKLKKVFIKLQFRVSGRTHLTVNSFALPTLLIQVNRLNLTLFFTKTTLTHLIDQNVLNTRRN